ncbi:MAG TPA: GTPase Era [Blastocatellia bacterium]|nr:GTPase Era [Blastocatellia bacterium]
MSDLAEGSGFKSGIVALAGRPNAGKSTLLNSLVGCKIAIVSDKPQTTRNRIKGFLTTARGQVIFVDTPGIHKPGYKLNRRMMAAVTSAIADVDLVLLIADATDRMSAGDEFALDLVTRARKPTILILNKIDRVRDKNRLLPLIKSYTDLHQFAEVIPISALTGDGVELLVGKVYDYLEEGPALYPEDELTDQPERVLVAELVREQILRATAQELPYVTAVTTEMWQDEEKLTRIHCLIYVERQSHRTIVIGKGGARLKQIGTAAREEIERLLGRHVFLGLHVKVREHWRDDEHTLDELGI